MKSMLAVAQLISRQKLRKIDVLTEDVLNAKNSKFRELYVGLRDGTIRSDREAALKLYDAGPSDARYRQLKSRFRKRLLNTLFFVDQSRPHRSSFDQTYHNCQRDWSLINILRVNGAEDPALQMTKSLLTVCLNYGFSELTVQTARFLANHAADIGDVKSGAQLQDIITTANKTYQVEIQSESILRRAQLLFHSTYSESNHAEIEQGVAQLQQEIDETLSATKSAMLFYNHLETSCILARTLSDKKRVISLVEDVIAYSMEAPRQLQENRVWKLCTWRLEAFIEQKDKTQGLEAVFHLEGRCKVGSEEWFGVQKHHIALMLGVGEYSEALRIAQSAQNHRNFRRIAPQEAEAFRLLELLAICFDQKMGNSSRYAHTSTVEAFLRKDATFGRDLQGLNAWRYLLKATLQHMLDKQTELRETIAAFRHLSVKHLNAKQDTRLIAMSQLLYRLERKHFRGELDRVGERYFNQLQMTIFHCSLRSDSFSPINVEDMLAFFGVNEFAALPQ
ncbi:MAG: hypothetical protein AB8F78_13915 [Saprospiraceae bacterium]